MSCLDPLDQFYILPREHKTTKRLRSPPPLHIENLETLESATAALKVSEDAPRPRKSSLAKPRKEGEVPTSAKSVRFGGVDIKIIPALKREVFNGNGLDLFNIIRATDEEFASLIGRGRQPDSPAPWREIGSKARWITEARPLSRRLAGSPTPPTLLPSPIPPFVKPNFHVKAKWYPFHCHKAAPSPACAMSFAQQRGLSSKNAMQAQYSHAASSTNPAPRPASHCTGNTSASNLVHNRSFANIRRRLALLRHLREMRQCDAARLYGTPLRNRRVYRRVHQPMPSGVGRARHISARRERTYLRQLSSGYEQLGAHTRSPVPSHQQKMQAPSPDSQRVRTYIDHIRDQRGPPKPLHAHFLSGSLPKVRNAVSN